MGEREKIFVFGASGHAKVVIDIIEKQNLYDILFLVDDNKTLKGKEVYGYKVVGGKKELLEEYRSFSISKGIVAIGSNRDRLNIGNWLVKGFN